MPAGLHSRPTITTPLLDRELRHLGVDPCAAVHLGVDLLQPGLGVDLAQEVVGVLPAVRSEVAQPPAAVRTLHERCHISHFPTAVNGVQGWLDITNTLAL